MTSWDVTCDGFHLLFKYLGREDLSPLSPSSRAPSLASKRISLLPCKSSVLRKISDLDHAVVFTEFRPMLLVPQNQEPPKHCFCFKKTIYFVTVPQLFLRHTIACEVQF